MSPSLLNSPSIEQKPVLTIFYQFNPWNSTIGGIQTIIRTFIKYAPDEFTVRLVGTATDASMLLHQWHEKEFEAREIYFMPLFMLKDDDMRHLIPTTLKYTAALAKHHFTSDFFHFHRLEPTLAAWRWQGDKTLFIHNDIHKQMVSQGNKNAILWRYFPQAYFMLEQVLVKQFNQIFSCNSESEQLYRQLYPSVANKVKLIKNTVDNDVFYPLTGQQKAEQRLKLAQQMNLPEDTQFILFAGRLHPQKDPLLLVRSLAVLNHSKVHLLVAGQGELADAMNEECHRLKITDRVTMLGALNQSELANIHRISSALVLSSVYEGLPLVALEALACGTPVVSTNCGETPRLLSFNSGLVCQERTPEALAEAITTVILDSNRFTSEACVQTAKPYSAKAVIQSIYSDMLNRWQPTKISFTPSLNIGQK
jgi:glycosyltransferase involved in cell wall biosynthesis